MKITNLIICMFIGNALGCRVMAQTPESVEFDGPENAPIYVIEGDFAQNYTIGGLTYDVDWSMSANPNLGTLIGTGLFDISGYNSGISVSFGGAVSIAFTVKQAGNVIRVNGKMGMAGSGYVAGYSCTANLTYNFSNIDVDPLTSTMGGYISAKGKVTIPGYGSQSINIPKTYLSQELPDVNSDGQWDSTGEWTADIDATVNSKGKIVGTGELTVWDEFGDAYDVIPQQVSGKLKNGVVSLAASGNSKPTSKIKVNLTYLESNDETVRNKSSVSAYGQNRKF